MCWSLACSPCRSVGPTHRPPHTPSLILFPSRTRHASLPRRPSRPQPHISQHVSIRFDSLAHKKLWSLGEPHTKSTAPPRLSYRPHIIGPKSTQIPTSQMITAMVGLPRARAATTPRGRGDDALGDNRRRLAVLEPTLRGTGTNIWQC